TNENKVFQISFFGCITTIVLVFFLYFSPLLLPNLFSDKNWKVGYQIILILLIILVIATFNSIYSIYRNSIPFNWDIYLLMLSRTCVLSIFPTAFITIVDYNQKLKYNLNLASNILKNKKEFIKNSRHVTHQISTDLKNETFSFIENDFIYAIADGNYTDICFLDENKLKKETHRVTLSSFEIQLKEVSSLVRCHRSYMVNLNKLKNLSGNAQGLKIELINHSKIIPVSRKYIPIVKEFFQKNS
ncbi:LytTR family transcriptional regulator, partial [Flavobacteriaceae bacterium]|nr:LytTR family transcriptional regulator [Flavobacteriaceae bacterium]